MDIQISFFPNAFLIPNSWLFADLYQYDRLSLHVPTADHPPVVVGHRVRSSNLQLHQEIVHFTFCCTSHFFLYNCKKLLRQLTRSLYLMWQCHKTSPFWLSAFFLLLRKVPDVILIFSGISEYPCLSSLNFGWISYPIRAMMYYWQELTFHTSINIYQ